MAKKSNKSLFIKKANEIHNNKYDYTLVNYKNNKTKVEIICPEHGVFNQRPDSHLNGSGCLKCKKVTNYDDFIIKANKIHKNKYKYKKFKWNNSKDKIKIICKIHGEFDQVINYHLNGSGCPKCSKNILSEENFFKKVKKLNNNYDYSKTIFKNTKIKIICPEHGEFKQNMWDHYNGSGCPICKKTTNNKDFINKSNKIHNFKYDYSQTIYENSKNKVKIICPEHGIFKQSPNHHLRGEGCPNCINTISKGEKIILNHLIKNKIVYIHQHKFDDCKFKNKLSFDFYLPEKNICIEYDGKQHYKMPKSWGGEEKLKLTQKRDQIKNEYCKNNNIRLIRIKYNENVLEKLTEHLSAH
jgi:very-short-patch-repair endonuclease